MLWRAAQLHGSYAQDGHDHELRRVVTQSRLPWNDMAGRVADERQKELDAIRRSSDETYWSARLANRWDADCPADASLEPDPHSTLEVLASEADTIFADLQGRVGDTRLAGELAKVNLAIAQDNVRLRARFLDEVKVLATPDAARHVGEDAATLDRWRAERRIIGVPAGAAWLFPMFQFKDGAPRPVIARTLAELPYERSPWPNAFWFVSSNSWLGGPAPMSLLDNNPDAVVWAAERERDEISG